MAPLLQHVHIRGLSPFAKVLALQNKLVTQNLLHKSSPSTCPAPLPTVISFTPPPVYTFGRRSPPSLLDDVQLAKLKEPMTDWNTGLRLAANLEGQLGDVPLVPEVKWTQRGGLTTFHGPGQVVIFPVIDLKGESIVNEQRGEGGDEGRFQGNYLKKGLDVRSYVSLLEETTIGVLQGNFGIKAKRTENPGVWVDIGNPKGQANPEDKIAAFAIELARRGEGREPEADDCKIAALGVHLRRHITSYGVAINCYTDLRWFNRITACGLEGLGTTTIHQLRALNNYKTKKPFPGIREDTQQEIAESWVRKFASGIWGIPGPSWKIADEIWNSYVQSRVWGTDMGGMGEDMGIDNVSESLQNTIGKWPLPIEDLPRKVTWKAKDRYLRRRRFPWKMRKVLNSLEDEMKEIRKQTEGKRLNYMDISRIVKALGDLKLMEERETAPEEAGAVKSEKAKKVAKIEMEKEKSRYRMETRGLIREILFSAKGSTDSWARPLLLGRDEKVKEPKKIPADLWAEMEKKPDEERAPLRSPGKDEIRRPEKILEYGMDVQEEKLVSRSPLVKEDAEKVKDIDALEETSNTWTPLIQKMLGGDGDVKEEELITWGPLVKEYEGQKKKGDDIEEKLAKWSQLANEDGASEIPESRGSDPKLG